MALWLSFIPLNQPNQLLKRVNYNLVVLEVYSSHRVDEIRIQPLIGPIVLLYIAMLNFC